MTSASQGRDPPSRCAVNAASEARAAAIPSATTSVRTTRSIARKAPRCERAWLASRCLVAASCHSAIARCRRCVEGESRGTKTAAREVGGRDSARQYARCRAAKASARRHRANGPAVGDAARRVVDSASQHHAGLGAVGTPRSRNSALRCALTGVPRCQKAGDMLVEMASATARHLNCCSVRLARSRRVAGLTGWRLASTAACSPAARILAVQPHQDWRRRVKHCARDEARHHRPGADDRARIVGAEIIATATRVLRGSAASPISPESGMADRQPRSISS